MTPALSKDVFIAGPSSLDLYLKSSKANTDIQVTLTEVRPDGKETYVQNGWLRASHRAAQQEGLDRQQPGPDLAEDGRRAAQEGQVQLRPDPDLPGRPRFPGRLEDPPEHPGSGR